jgi:hypothetical protein
MTFLLLNIPFLLFIQFRKQKKLSVYLQSLNEVFSGFKGREIKSKLGIF